MYSEIANFIISDGDQVRQTELYEIFPHLLILYHRCKFLVQRNRSLHRECLLAIILHDFKPRLKHGPIDLLHVALERLLILHVLQYQPSLLHITELLSFRVFRGNRALGIRACNFDAVRVELLLRVDLHTVVQIDAMDQLLQLILVEIFLPTLVRETLGRVEHRAH